MGYSDKHKIVLQTLIHKGALDENDGKELIITLFDHNDINVVINEINAKLQCLNMAIKYINCEVTGEMYWVLINTVLDKSSRFSFEYSEAELSFLRNIYSGIITSKNGCMSSILCLNLCSSLDLKLSKASAEKFLHNIVEKKWLCYKDGQYYIGVRSIAELLQYFKDTYEDDLHTCTLCNQALFYGKKCNKCETMTHAHCWKDYTMNQITSRCPNCQGLDPQLDNPGENINPIIDVDDTE